VKNPDPIARAWRLESRRKELGSDNARCCYCRESDIECLEIDHPVTRNLDPQFKRVVCRNDHRKLELKRDLKKLTLNGRRDVHESKPAQLRRYMLLLAEDLELVPQALSAHGASSDVVAVVAATLQPPVDSIKRKAAELENVDGLGGHPELPGDTTSTKNNPAEPAVGRMRRTAERLLPNTPDDNHSGTSANLSAGALPNKRREAP
jgi:hypothetical protein